MIKNKTFWLSVFYIGIRELEKICIGLEKELRKKFEIDCLLTDDMEITRLNRKFLGLNSPTNVLSFPYDEGSGGSIMISLESVYREAFIYGQNPDEHFIRVFVHGVLHLLGFDHSQDMFDLTEKFVKEFSTNLYKIL